VSDPELELREAAVKGRDAEKILDAAAESYFLVRQGEIEAQVFEKIRAGDLDPSFAVQQWIAMYEFDRVTRDLRKLARAGHKASDKIATKLSVA